MNENHDLQMASLLGEAPATPDPSFRYDVIVRSSERARRRRAIGRGLNQVAIFSSIGLIFPLLDAFGVTWQNAQPVTLTLCVVAAGLLFAGLVVQGPRTVLSRSRAMLHWI